MAAYTKIPNVIFTCFIGFIDPENMGIATKTKFLWVSSTEILAKPNSAQTGGGHFEMYFLNDEARVGNSGSFDKLFSMIIWACKKKSACGYFFPGYATLGANAPVLVIEDRLTSILDLPDSYIN